MSIISNELNVCRLCMNSGTLSDIFETDGITSMSTKISSCIEIEIKPQDGLPLLICTCCKLYINWFYSFKQKCIEVNSKLKAICKPCPNTVLENIIQANNCVEMKITIKNNVTEPKTEFGTVKGICLIDNTKSNVDNGSNKKCWPSYVNTINSLGDKLDTKIQSVETLVIEESKTTKLCQCDLCGRTFKSRAIFNNHVRTHTGVKLFPCELCPKRFARLEGAQVHMRSHLGIKPYICEVCGRSFTKSQDLSRHLRIHSDEKNYSCSHCERRFKRSHDVLNHMRTHTGARPYECKSCDKKYTSYSSRRKHYERHCKKEQNK